MSPFLTAISAKGKKLNWKSSPYRKQRDLKQKVSFIFNITTIMGTAKVVPIFLAVLSQIVPFTAI